jgi:hypothetical protein
LGIKSIRTAVKIAYMSESGQLFNKNINYLRDVITFGYFFLLIIGFMTDSIMYDNLGIEILHYSSVFDLLVSPIVTMTSNVQIFISTMILLFGYPLLMKWLDKNHGDKQWVRKFRIGLGSSKNKGLGSRLGLFLSSLLLLIFYSVGIASGRANALNEKIGTKTYKLTHRLDFKDGTKMSVMLIGQNTQYIFYVPEGTSDITVSPMLTNIKKLVQL